MELSECCNLLNCVPTSASIAKMLIEKLGSINLNMYATTSSSVKMQLLQSVINTVMGDLQMDK